VLAAVVVALVLALALASCDSGSSDSDAKSSDTTSSSGGGAVQAASEPAGAQAAAAKYVKDQGFEYAGDCADAELPADKGKWCSTLVQGSEKTDTQTYDVGPVGEKPEKVVTVKRRASTVLTPGNQVAVGNGDVGTPSQLTRQQLQGDVWITGNLVLDQQAGVGTGLNELPQGATTPATPTTTTAPPANGGTGGTGGAGGTGGTGGTPTVGPGNTGQYPPRGVVVVDNPTVQVGGEAFFRGSGCTANELLTISFDGTPVGTIHADPSGAFAGSLSIPPGTAPGAHQLTVRGSACVFTATVTVVGANLAFTGSSSHTSTYVLGGIAAVVVGLVLVVTTRRRRHGVRGRRPPPAATA
jgi:LPXTG-motif cell wall-anchored protein